MSENKCPMPGCDGEIIYHGTEFGPDYDSWHGCTKCHFMCDLDHLPRIAAAMELAQDFVACDESRGLTPKIVVRVIEVFNG